MFIHAKANSLFPILVSAVHSMPLSRGMARQAREAWCACVGGVCGHGQAVIFPIYAIQGSEKHCAVVVPRFLALQCALMCVCVFFIGSNVRRWR
jgi:hypothetical protein